MKAIRISFAVLVFAIASLGMIHSESSSERFASALIHSLQQMSHDQFGRLFPTLNEFYDVMEPSYRLYGGNLEAAKQEFADEYNHRVAPGIIESYESVQHNAAMAGIDWDNVSVDRIVVDEGDDLEQRTMTIYFSANGRVHRLVIEKVFKLKGQWKAGGNMKLN